METAGGIVRERVINCYPSPYIIRWSVIAPYLFMKPWLLVQNLFLSSTYGLQVSEHVLKKKQAFLAGIVYIKHAKSSLKEHK